jgi:Leucine-rich repeat (LRR) protein
MIKRSIFKTAILCLIAGLSLSGCNKNDPENGKIPVTGVSLNETTASLTVGETLTLMATVTPDNATNKTLTWTSSNTAVATVNNGTVSALTAGEAVITVKTADDDKTATCAVTVVRPGISMTTAKNAVEIRLSGSGTESVDWGDGNSEPFTLTANTDVTISHTYTSSGTRTIRITGTNITYLNCSHNQLSALDVSKNTALTTLSCYNNQLSALDVSKNTVLTVLYCGSNQLSALDVSKNTALTVLYCSSNQLSALDVSKNTALTTLNCYNNQLSALDVSKNTALTEINCGGNKLSTAALNALFGSLHSNGGLIRIYSNPGVYYCDRTIATSKGWTVIDY